MKSEAEWDLLIAFACLGWGGYQLAGMNAVLIALGLCVLARSIMVELKQQRAG